MDSGLYQILISEFHLDGFAFVVHSVERGHYVEVAEGIVWEYVVGLVGNGHDVAGIVEIHFLPLVKSVYHVFRGLIHIVLCLGGGPEQARAVAGGDYGQFARPLGGSLVYPWHGGLQCWIAVICLFEHGGIVAGVVAHGFGIPLA